MKDVNLLPNDIIDDEENRKRLRQWIIITSAFLILFSVIGVIFETDISRTKHKISTYTKERDEVKAMAEGLNLLTEEKNNMGLKQGIMYEIIDSTPWHQVFERISNCLNPNTWLEQMDINNSEDGRESNNGNISDDVIKATGGYFASINKPEKQKNNKAFRIALTGYAISNIDLAEFMASLSAAGRFKSVNLEFAERTKLEGSEPVKFLIKCEI